MYMEIGRHEMNGGVISEVVSFIEVWHANINPIPCSFTVYVLPVVESSMKPESASHSHMKPRPAPK